MVSPALEKQKEGDRRDRGGQGCRDEQIHRISIAALSSRVLDGLADLDPAAGPRPYSLPMGRLYLVATPIGNLGDITLRALEALKESDLIACEDTRHTIKLLSHYGIRKPLVACHANDEERGSAKVLTELSQGKTVSYCSDAGTPGLSDPGALLARRCREAGHAVSPLPGPSAFAALVSAAGFGGRAFLFDGFPSPKAGKRKRRIGELMAREESFVLYESPHRILKLLEDIASIDAERGICVGREMTKIHEEFIVGTSSEALERLSGTEPRGEFAVLVRGAELA
jgi:16S rRNA (cytidine1402-2'-O)-methyltransferase